MIPEEAKSSLKVGTVLGWFCHWVPLNLFFFFFHPVFQNSLAARPHGLCSQGLCCVEWGLAPVKLFQAAETAHWQGEGAWWRHTRKLVKASKWVRQRQEKVQRSMIICGFWTPGSSPGSEQKTIAYWPQHLAYSPQERSSKHSLTSAPVQWAKSPVPSSFFTSITP